MPVHEGKDEEGKYMQWGEHGKKYYFKTMVQRDAAYAKAAAQGRAVHASGWKGS